MYLLARGSGTQLCKPPWASAMMLPQHSHQYHMKDLCFTLSLTIACPPDAHRYTCVSASETNVFHAEGSPVSPTRCLDPSKSPTSSMHPQTMTGAHCSEMVYIYIESHETRAFSDKHCSHAGSTWDVQWTPSQTCKSQTPRPSITQTAIPSLDGFCRG